MIERNRGLLELLERVPGTATNGWLGRIRGWLRNGELVYFTSGG